MHSLNEDILPFISLSITNRQVLELFILKNTITLRVINVN